MSEWASEWTVPLEIAQAAFLKVLYAAAGILLRAMQLPCASSRSTRRVILTERPTSLR